MSFPFTKLKPTQTHHFSIFSVVASPLWSATGSLDRVARPMRAELGASNRLCRIGRATEPGSLSHRTTGSHNGEATTGKVRNGGFVWVYAWQMEKKYFYLEDVKQYVKIFLRENVKQKKSNSEYPNASKRKKN